MKFTRTIGALALALGLGSVAAYAGGMFQNYPVVGASSTAYCALYAGDGTTCVENIPAGPTVFNGNELAPADTLLPNGNQPQTVRVPLVALGGTGPMIDLTTVATSQTIPNNTPFYFLDGAQGSALTVTMPASAVEGQIQRIVCTAATVGTLTVAANTNQTLKNNPNTACTAGVGYAWRYRASNSTWYRFN